MACPAERPRSGAAQASRDRAAGNSGNVRLFLPGRALVFGKPLAGRRAWGARRRTFPGTYDNPERREDGQVSGGK